MMVRIEALFSTVVLRFLTVDQITHWRVKEIPRRNLYSTSENRLLARNDI
jgi:hypothetical protein